MKIKGLNDYINLSGLYEQYGAFYAFSKEQYNDKAKPNTDYCALPCGLIVPISHAAELSKERSKMYRHAIELQKKDYTKEQIIFHELMNHECFYSSDSIIDAIEALQGYDYTEEEIRQVYKDRYKETVEELC